MSGFDSLCLEGRAGTVRGDTASAGILRSQWNLAAEPASETPTQLLDVLDSGRIDYALIGLGDDDRTPHIYEAMTRHHVTTIGEYLDPDRGRRYLLLTRGRWEPDSLEFVGDRSAGSLRLDLPVLAPGKTSIIFQLPDRPGALVRALGPMSRRHVNVSNLEMYPAAEDPRERRIVADVEGYANQSPLREALTELNRLVGDVHVLGAYPAG
ncbi:MAG TPA: ACT domain-containing protein [Chloroflexota bacterium]|nr:ACT domain-containing protein [Chloroflexota bacterium]